MSSNSKILKVGFFFTAISRYSGILLSILVGAILARLLTPDEFGIIAIVTIFSNFFRLLSNFGLGPAIIQNKSIDNFDIKSYFTLSTIIAIVLSILFFFSSKIISLFFDDVRLIKAIQYLSISVFIFSLQVVPKALLLKELRFKENAIFLFLSQFISSIVAIILALNNFSYYSIIFKVILDSFLSFIIFYTKSSTDIGVIFNKNLYQRFILSIKKIYTFSLNQFLFNIVNYFSKNLDNILIAKFLGATPLAFYDKSYRLMLMPVHNLTHVLTPVFLPVLSKYQNHKKIYVDFKKLISILSLVGFSLSVFLFFNAKELILIVYGDQWHTSIEYFQILSLAVGFLIVTASFGSIFQAIDRTKLLLKSGIFSCVSLLTLISFSNGLKNFKNI